MKQYLHQLRQGLILWLSFGLTASAVFCGTYFAIKARSTSKSTTDSDTSAIYSSAGDTLTAAKRNTLVDNTKRHEMDINDTTTPFNTNCERRRDWGFSIPKVIPTNLSSTELRFRTWSATARRAVKSSNKKQAQLYSWTTRQSSYDNLTKLQYRCP